MTDDLNELAELLRTLHRELIALTRAEYERTHGPVPTPTALWHLLTGDPFFAWLRPLSQLMAQLDETLEQPAPPDSAEQAALRASLERFLLTPSYVELLQVGTDLVVAHAQVRRVLDRLTQTRH